MAEETQQEILLLKLGEVVLKGLNRNVFEDKLMSNVSRRLRDCGHFQIYTRQSTIYVEPMSADCDVDAACEACGQVFGVAAVARAKPCAKTVEAITETAVSYLQDEFAAAKSFKVESKRADKRFPMTSIQLSQEVGGNLAEAFPNVPVDVHNPDLTVNVEIREKYGLRPRRAAGGRGRSARGHGRQGGFPALRRHRLRRCPRG
jgi:thiamine biosynthesis protein ThiI